jgi:putative acetyltransferase
MNNSTTPPAVKIIRTDSSNEDFRNLVRMLDQELEGRYGEDQKFFSQFNTLEKLKSAVVLFVDDTSVACGAFRPHQDNCAEIKRMFVHPDWRGKGLAQQILLELESWASESFEGLVLETGLKQPEAIRLYERWGFERIPNYPPYIDVKWSVCMKKLIIRP